jgi:alpha-tubulin suppressor-like RCC1 family protein
MALTGGGCVWTCGNNDYGQLGHGDRTHKHLLTRVDPGHFGGANIVMAACGDHHSVVAAAGDVFTWGRGSFGHLGHNDEQDRLAPARLGREQFGGGKIVFLSSALSLSEGGVLWVWGFGGYGQLGLGDRDDRMVPTRLGAGEVFTSFLSLVRMAACGGLHTLVATEEGVVWAFGRGEHGRLGLNNKDDRLVPTRVDPQRFGGAQVATVAGGAYHSAAVTEGGALFTWGKGKTDSCHPRHLVPGGLGHADLRDRRVPTLVSPRLLGGARVGRWHGLAEELALSFAMGTHARLGPPPARFHHPLHQVRRHHKVRAVVLSPRRGIALHPPRPPPARAPRAGGEAEGFGEGVLRLMGAGSKRRLT